MIISTIVIAITGTFEGRGGGGEGPAESDSFPPKRWRDREKLVKQASRFI